MDGAARRLPVRRHRDRDHQPRDRLRRRSPSCPPQKSGMGSGINTTFRQVGIATGVAALGAVFQSQVSSKLAELLPQAPRGLRRTRLLRGAPRGRSGRPPAQQAESRTPPIAFVSGFNEILLIGGDPLLRRRRARLRPRPSQRLRAGARRRGVPPPSPPAGLDARARRGESVRGPLLDRDRCCASCGSRTCC